MLEDGLGDSVFDERAPGVKVVVAADSGPFARPCDEDCNVLTCSSSCLTYLQKLLSSRTVKEKRVNVLWSESSL
jgi:hypothetical protein